MSSNWETSQITLANQGSIPKMDTSLFGDKLRQLQQDYQSNKLLSFRIPVVISNSADLSKGSFFNVFIQRDDSLKESDEFYIRAGITLPDIQMLRSKRVRALLSARDDAVSTFLGDAETPAHTKWEERKDDFRGKYIHARDTLRFIQSSMREIVKILDYIPPGLEPDFLKGVFSIPKGTTMKPDITIKSEIPLLNVERIKAGFRLSLTNKTISLPIRREVKVAYDTQRGNPFTRYNSLDFDLTKNSKLFRVKGGKVLNTDLNKIEIEIRKYDFGLQVIGFDENRDVVVLIR